MTIEINLNYKQLLTLVKQLSQVELAKFKEEISQVEVSKNTSNTESNQKSLTDLLNLQIYLLQQ